jgi:diadenosine tetraphosphate (Ap4A) HIT family hydrolase
MTEKCLFCDRENAENHQIFAENDLFYARWDNFPISKGHSEIVSKKHTDSFFDLTEEEILHFFDLIKKAKEIITEKYHPDAFNIGVNDGEAAGRTIHHLHIHLIPRYLGDMENPRGGVRNIIPGKGNY